MKLEIDTTNRTITLKEKVELKELVDLLDKLLENDWEEYSVIPEYLLNSPITFPIYQYTTYPLDATSTAIYEFSKIPAAWK